MNKRTPLRRTGEYRPCIRENRKTVQDFSVQLNSLCVLTQELHDNYHTPHVRACMRVYLFIRILY